MNLSEMTIVDVEKRLAELDIEVRNAEDIAVVEKATEEKKALLERKAELTALEERKAAALEIGAGADVKKIDERKDEKKMEKTYAVDSKEYRDAYMKNLMGVGMTVEERTALSVAANVIPTETVNKIYGKLEENPLIAEMDILRIPGYVSVPVATTVNDAAWVAMDTAATDSADVIGKVSLTAKKLIKTIEITADIKAMSIPAFESWLVAKLAQKMETAICAAVINGAGSSDAKGIGQENITLSTAISTPTIAKLSAFMGGLGAAYHKNAVWIMSASTFYGKVAHLGNDVNGILLMNGVTPMLLGHKVIFDEHVDGCKFKSGGSQEASNANHIIYGSLKDGYVFNMGEGISIEADGSVAFRSGSTVYRGMALCDGAVCDPSAFVLADIS